MSLVIQRLGIDCHDPKTLSAFWREALGWRVTCASDDQHVLEPAEDSPQDGVAADLLFLKVPENKTVKNRLHLDLRPDDQAAEVQRLLSLGAATVDIGQGEQSWVVMADPEGNEFCVLRALTAEELAE